MGRRCGLPAALVLLLWAATVPAEDDKELARLVKLFADEFVDISPGKGPFPATYQMGSADGPDAEKPRTEIALKRPFRVARYEVTQELYEAVVGKNPSRWKGKRNSVEKVNWDEAVAFCDKATKLLRERKLLGEDEVIRLPSEAEWEYCCRAGTDTAYSFGDKPDKLGEYAWFTGNAAGNDPAVGAKKPNPWGLYDMHGYVWEWCQDDWSATLEGVSKDGSARVVKDAREKALRGGSWMDKADLTRSAYRGHQKKDYCGEEVGFRCVAAKVEE